jgi:hypothetical protein
MYIYERDIYMLIKKDLPVIRGKSILVDNNKGGELLVYNVYREKYKEIKILGFTLRISVDKSKPTQKVYIRTFKKNWDTSKNRLSPNHWGRQNNPLINLWCEINKDFEDLLEESNNIFVIDYVYNKILHRYLRNHTNYFIIEVNQINNSNFKN